MIQEFLGQTNFAGRDGFYWWVGQVETQKGKQAKGDDRYKVRIVGQHLKDCNAVAYEDLPWAIVMMPATAPRREGGTSFQSVEYKSGDWVIGFFLDGSDGQQPIIMGSIGQQYKASETHTGKEKPASDCLAFTTFLDPDTNINAATPASQAEAVKSGGVDGTNNPSAAKPDLNQPPNVSNEAASQLLLGTKCCNSETNPAGEYFCVEVADAKCESAENDKSKFEGILTELFGNISNNGGQLGTNIVGKYTGKLYDYIDIAQGYANKAVRLASSMVARIKGEIFAFLKQGAKGIIDFLLTTEVVDVDATNAAMNAAVAAGTDPNAVKPAKKRVGRLRGLTAWINEQLKNVNCVMDDLDERLRQFIEELIFGALDQVINAAQCFIDDLIGDIFDKIASFIEDAINAILGPLQALLTIIASPLDILGAAIAQIFDMLGITCGGSDNKCSSEEQLKNCTGPCGKETDKNFLDDLLAAIEDGNLDTGTGSCSESLTYAPVNPTVVVIVGGTTNPSTYTGTTPRIISSPTTDPTTDPNIFNNTTPPSTTSTTSGEEFITPSTITPTTSITLPINSSFANFADNGLLSIPNTGSLTTNFVGGMNPSVFTTTGSILGSIFTACFDNTLLKIKFKGKTTTSFEPIINVVEQLDYTLTVDKLIVFEGDSITFTLVANGAPVADGTVFNYAMFGDIDVDDFIDKKTTGTMKMFGNVATVRVTIADDALDEPVEQVTFNVLEASRSVAFSIAASDTTRKEPVPDSSTDPAFIPPVLGKVEVCGDGRIMDVPIETRGDAYLTPPIVIIRGAGFGASAKAELDGDGYLKKIRIQRSGTGYAPNRVRQNCVVSNFVMVNPGSGYYKNPMVYVDGRSNVATAIIDSNGLITGIEVIDKTKTFACTPRVEIFGGNGLGAKAIAVMECRDESSFVLFQTELAPSGVDSVIDCP